MNSIDEARKILAICNHRSEDNSHDLLIYDKNSGIARCTRCGCAFTVLSSNAKPADDIKKVIDIIQTIKVMWPDMPEEKAEKLYSILPVLEDVDAIYREASYHMHMEELQAYKSKAPILKAI